MTLLELYYFASSPFLVVQGVVSFVWHVMGKAIPPPPPSASASVLRSFSGMVDLEPRHAERGIPELLPLGPGCILPMPSCYQSPPNTRSGCTVN